MSHPILQGFDVANVILQIPRSKCMSEFMEEELRAIGPLGTFVSVFGDTLPAIQFRPQGDALEFEFVALVGATGFVWEHQRVRLQLFVGFVFLERGDQRRGNGYLTFLFVLGLEPVKWLARDADDLRAKIDIAPGEITHLFVADSRQQVAEIENALVLVAGFQQSLDFFGLINRSDRLDIVRPVPVVKQFGDTLGLEQLRNDDGAVVGSAWTVAKFVELADEGKKIFALHILNESLGAGSREELQAVLVGNVGFWFPLWRFHVFEIRGYRFVDGRSSAAADLLHRLDAGPIRIELDGLATGAVDNFESIFDLFAPAAVLPPLDVVMSFRMNFHLAVNKDLIAEFTVRFQESGVEVPDVSDFHFFEDIDAIFSVAIAALGHAGCPRTFDRQGTGTGARWTPLWTPRNVNARK